MSELIVGSEIIWENLKSIGHFGIKLRKQVYEDELAKAVEIRMKQTSENVFKTIEEKVC